MVNVFEFCPAGTVTFAAMGTADGLLLLRATAIPPTGALPFSVTVPVRLVPPLTELVLRVNLVTEGGVTVSVVVVEPFSVAVMVTLALAATASVTIVNEAELLPAGTVTVEVIGTALRLLLVSDTLTPPVGAGTFRLTVPVELLPPIRVVGLTVIETTSVGTTNTTVFADTPFTEAVSVTV
jgi:hypothetical protein